MVKKGYDLLILGGGPGGYVAAIRAAQMGLRVALIEQEALGGTCLHHGCIPSKSLIRSAEVLSLIQNAEAFGIQVAGLHADFGLAVDRSQKIVQKLHLGIQHLMRKHRIALYPGRGKLLAPGQIEVKGHQEAHLIEGTRALISTGSRVQSLPGLKLDGKGILSSDEALRLRQLPASMAIVGGGAVGLEFAYIYSAYGVKVTILEMAPSLLPGEDRELSRLLARSFRKRGIGIRTSRRVRSVQDQKTHFRLEIEDPGGVCEALEAEKVLLAVGRVPNVADIGLEALGIEQDKQSHAIRIGEKMQTNVAGVYAIGDVTCRPALAHGAMAQGVFVAESIAGRPCSPPVMSHIPNAVYCQPQVASVGLNEDQARDEGYALKTARIPLSANGKALALGETEGFAKLVSDKETGRLLGAQIIGAEASELIGECVLALRMGGDALEFKTAIRPHPTLSETLMEAGAAILGAAIHF